MVPVFIAKSLLVNLAFYHSSVSILATLTGGGIVVVSGDLTDKSKQNFESEGLRLSECIPTAEVPFEDLVLKCYDRWLDDYVLIEKNGTPLGYMALNKHHFSLTGFERGQADRTVMAYIPHIHLEPELRGRGLGPRIYSWINEAVPLLANFQHSAMASGMWHKLVKKSDVIVVQDRGHLASYYNSRNLEIAHGIDPLDIMLEPGYQVMLNYRVRKQKRLKAHL